MHFRRIVFPAQFPPTGRIAPHRRARPEHGDGGGEAGVQGTEKPLAEGESLKQNSLVVGFLNVRCF